jgi:hypothetical protein
VARKDNRQRGHGHREERPGSSGPCYRAAPQPRWHGPVSRGNAPACAIGAGRNAGSARGEGGW